MIGWDHLVKNDVFTGMIGATLVGSVIYAIKGLPEIVWELFVWRCTTCLVVYNDDAAYEVVLDWLGTLAYTKRARQLRLMSSSSEEDAVSVTPGLGKHFFWHNGSPVLVERTSVKDAGGTISYKRPECLSIRMLGLSSDTMHGLMREVLNAQRGAARTHIEIHSYDDGYWRLACRKVKRSLESIIVPADMKSRLVLDIQGFYEARSWYGELGIPYRRGFLLYGPAGCGKTSLVLALAAHFSRRVYVLNLGSLRGDDALIRAITSVPENAFLLIEDIDAAQVIRDETKKKRSAKEAKAAVEDDSKKPISLSALLNAIDGAFSRDGRVLFMTTNYRDKIDEALIRPGRADRQIEVGLLDATLVRVMCGRFIQDPNAADVVANDVEAPVTAADLQGRLLQRRIG